MSKKVKRIGIDARFYGPLGKGLGRYTQEIVDNIIKNDEVNEYVIFLNKENFADFSTDNPRVKKKLANVRWYTLAEQILMPWFFLRERLDLVHIPHFNVPIFTPCKLVITIHDLILTKFATTRASTLSPFFYKFKNLAYKLVIKTAVMRARRVIAVSEFTKKDIIEKFKIKPEKIIVIYEGVADLLKNNQENLPLRQNDKDLLLGYNINNPFFLYVGNAYPHKNLEGLIEVFNELNKKVNNLNLVLVGKEDYFYKRVKEKAKHYKLWDENKKNNTVIFSGYIPDKDLKILFIHALAYIFPSFYEGFGLPPLEAMSNNCPVISSNKSSMPEIFGEAALYFNPEDKKDFIEKMIKIIDDEKLRSDLVKKGREQVKKYDWKKYAMETKKVYEYVLGID